MISCGVVAQSRRCLRYQLRDVLKRTRAEATVSASQLCFSSVASRGQNASEGTPFDPTNDTKDRSNLSSNEPTSDEKNPSGIVRKSRNPRGKVVGKEGRKQRFISQRITRDSLKKPYFVLVPQDVEEVNTKSYGVREPEERRTHREEEAGEFRGNDEDGTINAQLIEANAGRRSGNSSPSEVYASIDALKPVSPIVDKSEFDRLRDTIIQSYTVRQLRNYVIAPLRRSRSRKASAKRPSKLEEDIRQKGLGQWRRGTTPIEERHRSEVPKTDSLKKEDLAEQVMRVVWNLQIASEEQEIGELEISLTPWQLRLLFDILPDGRPQYKSLISPVLLRASEVRPYRPDNIMRITARRQDAHDIAQRVKLELLKVKRLELDLKSFSTRLASPGWPKQLHDFFSDRELTIVSEVTHALVMREDDNVLGIYGAASERAGNARRWLLSLLPNAPPTSFDEVLYRSELDAQASEQESQTSTPFPISVEPADPRIRRQYERYQLGRMVRPSPKSFQPQLRNASATTDGAPEDLTMSDTNFAGTIASTLQHAPELHTGKTAFKCHSTLWGPFLHLHHMPWKVHFCKLLQEGQTSHNHGYKNRLVTPLHDNVPGAEAVMSYLDDHRKESNDGKRVLARSRLRLLANFYPSPFNAKSASALMKLPHLQFSFKISPDPDDPHPLQLHGLRALLDEQNVKVPLSDHAVDLLFTRQVMVLARNKKLEQYSHFSDLLRKLQESFKQGGELKAPRGIRMFLPHWMVHGGHPETTENNYDVPVEYLFEQFEQEQPFRLSPTRDNLFLDQLAAEDRVALQNLPQDAFLEYRQVEGSASMGENTFFTMRRPADLRNRFFESRADGESSGYTASNRQPVDSVLQPLPWDTIGTSSESQHGSNEQGGKNSRETVQGVFKEHTDTRSESPDMTVSEAPEESAIATEHLQQGARSEDETYLLRFATSALQIARLLTKADAGLVVMKEKTQAEARKEQLERSDGLGEEQDQADGEGNHAIGEPDVDGHFVRHHEDTRKVEHTVSDNATTVDSYGPSAEDSRPRLGALG